MITKMQMRRKSLDRNHSNCERKWQTGKMLDRLPLKVQTWAFHEPSLPVKTRQDEPMAIQVLRVQLS